MTKTFEEVPKAKTVDFCDLALGDCFHYGQTYYMKLFTKYRLDNECSINAVDLKNGVLTFFCSGVKVKPYKDCEVILYE